MPAELALRLQRIGRSFRLEGIFFNFEEITQGNVNHTYKVNYVCDDGNGMAIIKPYLFQHINSYAFKQPDVVMQNVYNVTQYIRKTHPEMMTLHLHHTDDLKPYVADEGFWRVYSYIPAVTFDNVTDTGIVKNAGSAFGQFQMALNEFDINSLEYTIPDFHNTQKRYEKLEQDINRDELGRVESVRSEIDWLMSVRAEACRIGEMGLPLRVTHNDTKINNVLFDEQTHEALVVIDLDTVMPGYVAYDFGDAVRFAGNFTEEDSENTDKTGMDLNILWAFAEGFISKTAGVLTPQEIKSLSVGCFAVTCELAVRFLDDYITGDKYFKQKKPQHNVLRARCQIALAKDIQRKLHAIDAICTDCYNRYKG